VAAYLGGPTTKTGLAALPTAWSLAPGRPSTGVEDKEAAHGRNANVDGFFVWNGVPEVAGRSRTTKAESEVKRQHSIIGLRALHFVGGDPQSAGFCDGPGPGMALEQNPFLPPTRPGGENGKRRPEELLELLNITSRCITRSRHKDDSEDCATHLPKADSGFHRSREELYNVVLCYDADSWHRW